MANVFSRVKFTVSGTPGTGTVTVGTRASGGFYLPNEVDAADGLKVYYILVKANGDEETGIGTLGSSQTTISRDTVLQSIIGGVVGTTKISADSTTVMGIVTPANAYRTMRRVRTVTGTTDTLQNYDGFGCVTYNSASAVAVTLPQASASNRFLEGWFATIRNTNAGAVTITPTTSTINGASTLVLQNGDTAMVISDGTNYFAVVWQAGAVRYDRVQSLSSTQKVQSQINIGVREVLSANRTYYVRTDGNDSNTGLANTSGGAFLTINKAIDVATALDLSIYSVTIQVGAGTYTASIVPKTYVGAGPITIVGDETTPSNVTISTTSTHCINMDAVRGKYVFKGLKLTAATTGYGMLVQNQSVLDFQNIEFGSVASGTGMAHIYCTSGSSVTAIGNYSITGGAYIHVQIYRGGQVLTNSRTVTLTGTPAFTFYAYATNGAGYRCDGMTFTGSATGTRYNVSINSWIDTVGGGASYFPGNAAGSTSTGGQYI